MLLYRAACYLPVVASQVINASAFDCGEFDFLQAYGDAGLRYMPNAAGDADDDLDEEVLHDDVEHAVERAEVNSALSAPLPVSEPRGRSVSIATSERVSVTFSPLSAVLGGVVPVSPLRASEKWSPQVLPPPNAGNDVPSSTRNNVMGDSDHVNNVEFALPGTTFSGGANTDERPMIAIQNRSSVIQVFAPTLVCIGTQ